MSTPTLKLLLNALRLGQPQDPQAAIFALAEHLLAQDELIEELRKRITVVQSAAQILETKASRLESELEGWQQVFANMQAGPASQGVAAHAQHEREHARFQAEQARAQQQAHQQQQAQHAQQHQQQQQAHQQAQQAQQQRQQGFAPQLVPHGQAQHGPQPAAYQPPRPASQRPPAMPAGGDVDPRSNGPTSQPPPSMGVQQRAPSAAPPPASEPPPPFTSPARENAAPNYNDKREGTDPVRTRMVRSTPQMTRQQRAAALRGGREPLISDEESSNDDFKVETVVVHKKDLEKLKNQHPEAPFRLPPPGAGVGPDRGSIPGAPWARGNRVDIKVRPAVADEFTIDAIHHDSQDEGDDEESSDDEGETYRDAGGLPSLAAALGLSPGDPRLEALRRAREPNAGFDRSPSDDDLPTSSRRKR